MNIPDEKSLRRLRGLVTLGALLLALAHAVWPAVAIDAITIVLVLVALIPWLAPLFKSLEFPGGWKVEFQEFQKVAAKADSAGLLGPATPAAGEPEYAFLRVASEDPNLALAGLRIEIEKRLAAIAESRGLQTKRVGIGQLLRELSQREALDSDERAVLSDMVNLLNNAVHGATIDPRASRWAIEVGPRLLKTLDDRVTKSRPGS